MKIFGKEFFKKENEGYIPISPTNNYSGKGHFSFSNEVYEANKSIAFACLNVRAKAVAENTTADKLRIYERLQLDDLREVPVSHNLFQLLQNPNPYLTRYQFWYLTSIYLDLFGNSYWLINRNSSGVVNSLWILKSDKIKIIADKTNKKLISGYEYKDGTATKFYSEEEVVHIKYPNPKDPYFYGGGIIEKMSSELDIDTYIADFQRTFFENDATPPAIITFPNILNEKTRRAFEDSWLNKFKRKAGQIAVLEGGADVKVLGSEKEMSYINSYEVNRKRIQAIFGVPDSKLGYSENITARATLETIEYNFYKETILPNLTLISEQLNKDLLKLFGNNLILKLENVLAKDVNLQLQKDEAELRMGKVSINEVRERDGYDAIKGGEEPLIGMGLMKLSDIKLPKVEFANAVIIEKENKDKDVEWKNWESNRNKIEENLKKKFKPALKKMYSEILSEFKDQTKAIRETISMDADNLFKHIQDIFEKEFGKSVANEFKRFLESKNIVGVHYNPLSSDIKNAVKNFIEISSDIPKTTLNKLNDIITYGLENGFTEKEIKDMVDSKFKNEFFENQLNTIVRTSSTYASNTGIKNAGVSAGFQTKIWLSQRDDRVRDLHLDLDGVEVGLNEKFVLANGDRLDVPGDFGGQEESVINCRCTILFR